MRAGLSGRISPCQASRLHMAHIGLNWQNMTRQTPLTRIDVPRIDAVIAGMPPIAHARFTIGDVVRHRLLEFRGVVFDVDPVFANSEEWYQAIPEDIRPARDQPFYHLLAENAESNYVAYVSQQNLEQDVSDEPIEHPAISGIFDGFQDGRYSLRREHRH
jgi:heat shock protein HspQ